MTQTDCASGSATTPLTSNRSTRPAPHIPNPAVRCGRRLPPTARSWPTSSGCSLRQQQPVAWPSGRNDPCWCGTDRKYKKCCRPRAQQ
ncbi:MAG: hypothetical protein GEU97_24840 [Actinophytocola sp.]|nr:hypothetical protein [Actinophytocola sp.]